MKKILFLIGVILLSIAASAQAPKTPQSLGTKNNRITVLGVLKVDSAFVPPNKDTIRLAEADTGAIAYLNGQYYSWTKVGGALAWRAQVASLNNGESGVNPDSLLTASGNVGIVKQPHLNSGNGFVFTRAHTSEALNWSLSTNLTTKSIPFIGASGALSQNNSNFNFDDATNKLFVPNIGSPSSFDLILSAASGNNLDLNIGTTNALRISSDASVDVGTPASPFGTIKLNVGGNVQSNDAFVLSNGTNNAEFGISSTYSFVGSRSNHGLEFLTNDTRRAYISNAGAITFNTSSNSYTFPSTRGTAGQVLTDAAGDGVLSWTTVSGGGGSGMAIGATVTSGTSASALYVDGSGNLAQDNSSYNYNSSTKTLTIPNLRAPASNDLMLFAPSGQKVAIAAAGVEYFAVNTGGAIVLGNGSNSVTFPSIRGAAGTKLMDLLGNGTLTWARVASNSTTSGSTITPNSNGEIYLVTALAANATIAAPTGETPVDGQTLMIRILDNGTSRTLSWNSIYRGGDITLPTATTIGRTMYCQFIYNSAASKWDFLGLTNNY
jgi:hypothetical protein